VCSSRVQEFFSSIFKFLYFNIIIIIIIIIILFLDKIYISQLDWPANSYASLGASVYQ